MIGSHAPRAVRTRLLLAVAAVVLAALVTLTAGFNVLLRRSLDGDATNVVRARAAAALSTVITDGGSVRIAEAPDDAAADPQVWVFAGSRAIEIPPHTAPALHAAARAAAAARSGGVRDVPRARIRLAALAVMRGGGRVGTVVAAVSLAPYERSARLALIASVVLGTAAFAVVLLAARWILRRALAPVTAMTRQAEEWSDRDLGRRFALGAPYDELTELAATLDRLLDRIAASLRHEQRFSAELSHELRTPLARIVAEAELALRRDREPAAYRDAIGAIHRSGQQMARTVEALVASARHEAMGAGSSCDVGQVLAQTLETLRERLAATGKRLIWLPPSRPLRIALDGDLAERILAPLLENAERLARSRVEVLAEAAAGTILVTIRDDGPGVSPGESERIFEPGVRGSAGNGSAGAGLGLALARRLAEAAGGSITAVASAGGTFQVGLPAL